MRRVLLVNILIVLIFASVSYWSVQKDRLETAMAEQITKEQEEASEQEKTQKQQEEKSAEEEPKEGESKEEEKTQDYIKWVDFGVSKFAMTQAYEYDRDTYGTEYHLGWIDLLAWTAAHTGGNFENNRTVCQCMEDLQEQIGQGKALSELTKDLEYFSYYQEAYTAALGGMVGEYEIEVPIEGEEGRKRWEKRYGLKAFSPIAKGFPYNDYDDFGASRSYGYKRNHLGHDMLGQIGTPIMILTRVNLKNNF